MITASRMLIDGWVRVSRQHSCQGRDRSYHTSTVSGCDILRNLDGHWRWVRKERLPGHSTLCGVCKDGRTDRNQEQDYRMALINADPKSGWDGVDVPGGAD